MPKGGDRARGARPRRRRCRLPRRRRPRRRRRRGRPLGQDARARQPAPHVPRRGRPRRRRACSACDRAGGADEAADDADRVCAELDAEGDDDSTLGAYAAAAAEAVASVVGRESAPPLESAPAPRNRPGFAAEPPALSRRRAARGGRAQLHPLLARRARGACCTRSRRAGARSSTRTTRATARRGSRRGSSPATRRALAAAARRRPAALARPAARAAAARADHARVLPVRARQAHRARVPHARAAGRRARGVRARRRADGRELRARDLEIHKTVHDANGSSWLASGVQLGDGDGTVPLLSLGLMCAKGWRSAALNPAGMGLTTREYRHVPLDGVGSFMAGVSGRTVQGLANEKDADHIMIMGNRELITDLPSRSRRAKHEPLDCARRDDVHHRSLAAKTTPAVATVAGAPPGSPGSRRRAYAADPDDLGRSNFQVTRRSLAERLDLRIRTAPRRPPGVLRAGRFCRPMILFT